MSFFKFRLYYQLEVEYLVFLSLLRCRYSPERKGWSCLWNC